MESSSGSPTSFVPEPTDVIGEVKHWLDDNTGSIRNKLLVGLVLGLGIAALLVLTTSIVMRVTTLPR